MAENAVKGLLVMAYGTPESLDDVRPYLTHIRHGNEPSHEAVKDLMERYELIGGPSPLYQTTVDQMKALEGALNAGDGSYRGYLGMKHWRPFVADAVQRMAADGIERAVAITLAPHYSTMSIAQYLNYVRQGLNDAERPVEMLCIKSYHDEPLFIDALAEKLGEAMNAVPPTQRDGLPVIFTAHSLPEKILKEDDPYREQLLETSRLVGERFDGLEWRFAFTSQGETKDRWLGPTLAEALDEVAAAGHDAVMCCTVGFVSEHLETLYDFDIEGAEDARQRGLAFYRAPALGTSPKYIAALAAVVRKAEAGQHEAVVRLPEEALQAPTYPTYS
ncbi:MAG: ferrochelatase [Gemmatimonadetes bacterium]|uniref:Ferrochelatase n=1 Tax=Candidatus Kutchimonas denitrificans TaxID=3056748 RepID=A0AAE4Z617_9BACT|nr:ferrochelatase [Gemmatimonadota bacterium]NIR74014.1 ferrochelatase [Candidatus Kutchimonas denitrificans]NIS03003.1 ferrochelatase [Gemmatimonadota bacterium]NIT68720.1 ferrochelatase [Gemmatimonadota bacterium]NIU53301.1 ferrochelatase [Gemmatimonadota bacterium]